MKITQILSTRFTKSIRPQSEKSLNSMKKPEASLNGTKVPTGDIPDCLSAGCGFRCCYKMGMSKKIGIAVFPSEVEKALAAPHLSVLKEDYYGGRLMVCSAKNTATCDGGYKPMDCRFYPLFPQPTTNGDRVLSDTGKTQIQCPLGWTAVKAHAKRMWLIMKELSPEDREFARRVPAAPYNDITDELQD